MVAEEGCDRADVTRTRPQIGGAVDVKAFISRRSELLSSNNNGGLSESDL